MNFLKEHTEDYYLFDTNISNIFIDEYMADAPGDYVKVYLFALMYTDINLLIDNRDIAKHLSMDLEDVLKAWSYWEDAGVVVKHYESPDDTLNYGVEFLDLKSRTYGKSHPQNTGCVGKASDKKSTGLEKLVDEDISKLFKNIEKHLGKMLKGDEPQKIIGWIDIYDASPDVIEYAFRYAKQNWKGISVSSVGSLVIKWCEKGFRDVESVEAYLSDNDRRYNEYKLIMKAAGKSYNITPDEMATIDRWLDEWGYSVADIVDRFKRTNGINNPFKYVESIIKNEYEKGDDPKLKSSFTNDVYAYYERIRENNEKAAEKRRKEVYSKIPEIKKIDAEIRRIGLEIPKVILAQAGNSKEKAESLNRTIEQLQNEKENILTAYGFSTNYMETAYICSRCKDTGTLDNGERCNCFVLRMEELRS